MHSISRRAFVISAATAGAAFGLDKPLEFIGPAFAQGGGAEITKFKVGDIEVEYAIGAGTATVAIRELVKRVGARKAGEVLVREFLKSQVREAAQETSDELVTLSAADEPSGLIVCLVEQQIGDWLQVRLPTGPPDRTGWVARDDVTLSRHRFHIEVSLGERTLTLYTGEIEALSVPVAVGPDAPGAGEVRYIKELVQVPAQAPTYGRFAYGLSGSTTTLEALTAGEGVVAIHGTPDESRLGGAVDRGAVAVGDDILTRFVETIGLPLGTPVRFVE